MGTISKSFAFQQLTLDEAALDQVCSPPANLDSFSTAALIGLAASGTRGSSLPLCGAAQSWLSVYSASELVEHTKRLCMEDGGIYQPVAIGKRSCSQRYFLLLNSWVSE